MNIRNKNDIRVYNECPFQVNLVGQNREYVFPPSFNGERTMNFINFDDVEYAHSRTKTFSIGMLVFDEKDQDELYDALGIKNWKETVWFDKDIRDVIDNPTAAKLQKVIDSKDLVTIERVRGYMVRRVNEGGDVSQNVINIVNTRYREITSGVTNSKIVIRASDVEPDNTQVSEEVDALKRQLAEMQKLMEKMVASQASQNATAAPTPVTEEENTEADSEPVKTQAKRTRKTSTKK